jgi:uncharacterized protein YtpQ (UPF0354 family)
MRVRVFLALALSTALAVCLSACDSGSKGSNGTASIGTTSRGSTESTGTTTGPQTLSFRDFKATTAAAVVDGTDLEAEPGFGSLVDVSDPNGLDTLQLVLTDAYARYRAAPEKKQQIVDGLVREAVAQMKEGNSKRSFSEVRGQLLPLLKRKQAVEKVAAKPATTPFFDLAVVYGVQRDNSFALVTKKDLTRWGKPVGEIQTLAMANLERETNAKQKLLCEHSGSQKLCGWASGDGYDATRMLVPGLRRQIVKQLGGPAVYAVPLESVFVALTRNYAPVIKDKVLQQFTTGTNPLSPHLFEERDGKLFILSQ